MKTNQWKVFFDYEKEEAWLNERAAKGFAMTHYTLFRYTFEDCTPGEYLYRIELLKTRAASPESIKYIQFMEDSGAEHIASWLSWVYFRKKSDDGSFKLFSDLSTRIIHYQRLVRVWLFVGALILVQLANILIQFYVNGSQDIAFYLVFGSLAVCFIILFFRFLPHYIRKVKELKRERDIRE
jgi:hypothetical protein